MSYHIIQNHSVFPLYHNANAKKNCSLCKPTPIFISYQKWGASRGEMRYHICRRRKNSGEQVLTFNRGG